MKRPPSVLTQWHVRGARELAASKTQHVASSSSSSSAAKDGHRRRPPTTMRGTEGGREEGGTCAAQHKKEARKRKEGRNGWKKRRRRERRWRCQDFSSSLLSPSSSSSSPSHSRAWAVYLGGTSMPHCHEARRSRRVLTCSAEAAKMRSCCQSIPENDLAQILNTNRIHHSPRASNV